MLTDILHFNRKFKSALNIKQLSLKQLVLTVINVCWRSILCIYSTLCNYYYMNVYNIMTICL